MAASSAPRFTVDTRDLARLSKRVDALQKTLADERNADMKTANGQTAIELVKQLRSAASSSPTPQARLVAETVAPARTGVRVGGRKRVGSRRTPAGALLWGSEHGSATGRFVAGPGGNYWIQPAVTRTAELAAARGGAYENACNALLRKAGFL
jgi:hypothetical protein